MTFDTMQRSLAQLVEEYPAICEPLSDLSEAVSTFLQQLNNAYAAHPEYQEQQVIAMLAGQSTQLALSLQADLHKQLVAAAMAEGVRKHEAGRIKRDRGAPLIKSPNAAGPVLRRQR